MQLILASTSRYRKNLLKRLGLPFTCITPDVDETIVAGESASARARRLAHLKAAFVLPDQIGPPTLVIGSDQVACLDDQILRKTGTADRAVAQLSQCSGKQIRF